MAEHKIAWVNRPGTTGETWNPVHGCTPISPGCANCYARTMATRLRGRYGYPADEPFRVVFDPGQLAKPRHWKKPRTVFVPSMGDLFHPLVSLVAQRAIFIAMLAAPQHTYLVLTKRPQSCLTEWPFLDTSTAAFRCWPENVWIGVTAEDEQRADERIPALLAIRARTRFVSYEPLLENIDVGASCPDYTYDWAIIGCERGPRRRPCKLDWIRSLVQQHRAAGIPVFVKQLDLDGRVSGYPAEWPEDLRIREWPQ